MYIAAGVDCGTLHGLRRAWIAAATQCTLQCTLRRRCRAPFPSLFCRKRSGFMRPPICSSVIKIEFIWTEAHKLVDNILLERPFNKLNIFIKFLLNPY